MTREEEEKPKAFKVDDRRRFSPEGELKPEHRGKPEEPRVVRPATAAPAAESVQAQPGIEPSRAESAGAAAAYSRFGGPAAEINFETFVVGLSTQALMHLGEIPDPTGGGEQTDLPSAQQLIDIIGMLKEKTRGNLGREEESLLEAILFELRMKYVERARQVQR